MNFSILIFTFLYSLCLAGSPTGNYAPGSVQCPGGLLVREGNSLSQQEKSYIQERTKNTREGLKKYLKDQKLDSFNPDEFITDNTTINVAIAISGGGYRSMLTGAGAIAAFDNRTASDKPSPVGGILQSANYISALSGGSWLLGSLLSQDFPSIDEVVLENPNNVWDLSPSNQIFDFSYKSLIGEVIDGVLDNYEGFLSHLKNWKGPGGIKDEVDKKKNAGFKTSVTDYWGRALSYQLFTQNNDYAASETISDVRDKRSFQNHYVPFPLIQALVRRNSDETGDEQFVVDTPAVEFNPYEMGGFEPDVNAFHDVRYLGTKVNNGSPQGTCIGGFDNIGFVVGTSASLFNAFMGSLACGWKCSKVPIFIQPFIKKFLGHLSDTRQDVANYVNPFQNSQYTHSDISKDDYIYLYDGGLGDENTALSTLTTTQRAIDVVFTVDNSNYNGNPGHALMTAYQKQFTRAGASMVVPPVPSTDVFGKEGLTTKPVFFGCDAADLTSLTKNGVVPPLVVYLANHEVSYNSHVSSFKLSYTDAEKKAMVRNGYEVATYSNSTIDPEYGACVACAVVKREQERRHIAPSPQCQKCFERYCWRGTAVSGATGPANSGGTNSSDSNSAAPPGIVGLRLEIAANIDL